MLLLALARAGASNAGLAGMKKAPRGVLLFACNQMLNASCFQAGAVEWQSVPP